LGITEKSTVYCRQSMLTDGHASQMRTPLLQSQYPHLNYAVHPMIVSLRCLLLLIMGCLLTSRAIASGDENWEGFGIPGVDGEVDAMAVDGNDIYIGGSFRNAAGIYVGGIARWNTVEHRWYPLGDGGYPGVDGSVLAIAIRGDEIYVGGEFTVAGGIKAFNIALFNRRTRAWSTWGGGAARGTGGAVNAIVATTTDVYAGGDFAVIGSILATNVARWDGTRWWRLETGIFGVVRSLAMMGNDLYVGGLFTAAGSVNVSNIARWNGSAWSRLDSGVSGPVHVIYRDGTDLLFGGTFT
jgi:hypothetical protein